MKECPVCHATSEEYHKKDCPRDRGQQVKYDLEPTMTSPERPIFSHDEWADLLDETFANIRLLAASKGAEYSGDVDRLLNFRRNGADLELPMETVWRVYAAKHWDAIGQYIRDLQSGKKRERLEGIEGRIDDLLVYLLLFKAMVKERNRA